MRNQLDRAEVWSAVDDQRRALVRLLEDLSEDEWRQPSLCDGWSIRQVAAHVALQNTTWPMMPQAMVATLRHGAGKDLVHVRVFRVHDRQPFYELAREVLD